MIRRSCAIAMELVAGAVVLAGFGAWRLASGPIEIGALKPYVAEALSPADRGVRTEIGDLVLTWTGFGHPIDLRARRVAVFRDDGGTGGGRRIAVIPELGIGFDLKGLVQGRLMPTRLDAVGPQITVLRGTDGGLTLGLNGGNATDSGGTQVVSDMLSSLLAGQRGVHPGPFADLRDLGIRNGTVVIEDPRFASPWRAEHVDISLVRSPAGLQGTARGDLDLGQGGPARLDASLEYDNAAGELAAAGRFDGLNPAVLARRVPALAPATAADLALSGHVHAVFDRTLKFLHGRFDLAGKGTLALDGLPAGPIPVTDVTVRGSLGDGGKRLELDDLYADLGGPRLTLQGVTTISQGIAAVRADAHLEQMPIDALARYWPANLAPFPRAWLTANMSAGSVDQTSVSVDAAVPLDRPDAATINALSGEMSVSGATIDYLKPLEPVTDAHGTVRFDAQAFHIAVDGARLGRIAVGPSTIEITGIDKQVQVMTVDAGFSSTIPDALTALDQKPLLYAHRYGIDPKAASGRVSGRIKTSFPLILELAAADVGVQATAHLTDAAIRGPFPGLALDGGTLDLVLDNRHMAVTGNARLGGTPMALNWNEQFSGTGPATRIEAKGQISPELRARFGFDTAPYLTGPVGADLVYERSRAGKGTVTADLDLAPAALDLSAIGWSKPAGTPGRGHVVVALGAAPRIVDARLDAAGLRADGNADLSASGGVQRLDVTLNGPGTTDLHAALRTMAGGGYAVSLAGRTLDLRPMIRRPAAGKVPPAAAAPARPALGKAGAGGGPPLAIDVKLDRVVIGNGPGLLSVAGSARRDAVAWRSVDLNARTDQAGHALSLVYQPTAPGQGGATHAMELKAADAGSALKALGLYDDMVGGTLSITGQAAAGQAASGSPTLVGDVDIENYRLRQTPALARLLNAMSISGFAELFSNQGMHFDRLVGKYRWDDKGLWLQDVRTSGGSLGLTLDGHIDLAARTGDFEGTIVPVYGLNRLLGAIPLIGNLLSGGAGQGLFAATYHMQGPLDDMSVSVNPLAALAPGFLRNLFFLGNLGASPETPKPPAPPPPPPRKEQ